MLGGYLRRAFADAEVLAWGRAECDVTDCATIAPLIAAARPDVVVNATGYTAVDRAEGDRQGAELLNAVAVAALAEASAMVGAVFVHCSTDYVFDGTRSQGWGEHDTPNPLSVYGCSKLRGEEQVQSIAEQYPGWRWYIVRTSRLFGDPGRSESAKRPFLASIFARAETQDRIEVIDADMASPTYVDDLARAIAELVLARVASGIYHRTNDGACTWYGFARSALARVGWKGVVLPIPPSQYARPAPRPAYSVLRTTKLPPLRPWESALQEYLAMSPSALQLRSLQVR